MPLRVIKNSVLADPKFELIKCLMLTALKYLKGSYNHPRLTGSTSPKKFFTLDSNCWSHPTKKKYICIVTMEDFGHPVGENFDLDPTSLDGQT